MKNYVHHIATDGTWTQYLKDARKQKRAPKCPWRPPGGPQKRQIGVNGRPHSIFLEQETKIGRPRCPWEPPGGPQKRQIGVNGRRHRTFLEQDHPDLAEETTNSTFCICPEPHRKAKSSDFVKDILNLFFFKKPLYTTILRRLLDDSQRRFNLEEDLQSGPWGNYQNTLCGEKSLNNPAFCQIHYFIFLSTISCYQDKNLTGDTQKPTS